MHAVEASNGHTGDSQLQDIHLNVEEFGLARKVALRRETARQKVSSLAFDRRRNAINRQRALGRNSPRADLPNDGDDPLSQLTDSRRIEDAWRKVEGGSYAEEEQHRWEDEEGRWKKDQDTHVKSSSKEQIKDAKKRRLFNANLAAPAQPYLSKRLSQFEKQPFQIQRQPVQQDGGDGRSSDIPGLPANSRYLVKDPSKGVGTAPGKEKYKALPIQVQGKPFHLDVEKAPGHSLDFLGSFDMENYLSAQRMLEGQGDAMKHFQFNQVASDATPPDRELHDVRHLRCVSAIAIFVIFVQMYICALFSQNSTCYIQFLSWSVDSEYITTPM